MTPLEIVLILCGIACIIASCFFIDRRTSSDSTDIGHIAEQVALTKVSEAGDQIIRLKDETIREAKEELARISNEKIMAVHEYSDQVLGSIEKSHQEVMFLYTMLTTKEDDMKDAINQIQQTKREVERFCSMTREDVLENRTKYSSQEQMEQEHLAQMFQSNRTEKASPLKKLGSSMKNSAGKGRSTSDEETLVKDVNGGINTSAETEVYAGHIEDICRLADQGYSVAQISKQLSLGQREVKLVLDFHGRKH